MKLRSVLPALSLAIFSTCTKAEDFSIEEEKLSAVPKAVEASIRGSKNFESNLCKLIGKPIDLAGEGTNSGFVVTTANACDWGAALGPIWVVRDGAKPVVVLSYGGYSLTLGKQKTNGFRNVAISAGTAGRYTESLWKFNGEFYAKAKEKSGVNR